MRPDKIIIAAVFAGLLFTRAIGQMPDFNDIAAYYGFGEMEIIKSDWGIKDLRIADFNGDGRNDIAVVNNRKARIELLIQKDPNQPAETATAVDPEDADINAIFDSLPARFRRETVPLSLMVYSLVCGDLNSDGMTDMAFYGGDPRGLYVLLQKADQDRKEKSQTLSWRTRKKIKIEDGLLTSNSLICDDLNNDRINDLVLAGQDVVYIILQKEDGSLAEPVKYATVARTLGVEASDLNGDNINDLILVTDDQEKPLHVRFGLAGGRLGPQVKLFIEKPWAFEPVNIDGTAGDEILTVDSRSGRLSCYKFSTGSQKDSDWPICYYPLECGEGSIKRDLAVGDFDGDGLADIVLSDPAAAELVFYKQTKGTGLAEPLRFPAFADITALSAADIDDDNKSELAVLSVKEKVIGLSRFENERLSFPQPVDLTGEPVAMELVDVDNDDNIDCLYISKDANDVRFLKVIYDLAAVNKTAGRLKKGKKTGQTEPALELKKLAADPEGLKVLDLDQDGLADVLIFVEYEQPVLVRQMQKRKFEVIDSPKAQASLIKDACLRSIAVANVDGQTGLELLVAQKNFARSLIFAEGQSWSIIDQYNARSTDNQISAVAAFDIDDEEAAGKPAILLLDGQKGLLQILKAGADGTWRLEKELNVGRWNAVTHLKMLYEPLINGNSKSILLFDNEKFAILTPPDNGNSWQYLEQQFSYETKIKDGVYGNLTTGDINADGRTDIIMVEYKNDHIEILALDSQTKPVPAMRFKIFEQKSYSDSKQGGKVGVEPREMKVADVTGDGKNDLVTLIHDRIIIYPQD